MKNYCVVDQTGAVYGSFPLEAAVDVLVEKAGHLPDPEEVIKAVERSPFRPYLVDEKFPDGRAVLAALYPVYSNQGLAIYRNGHLISHLDTLRRVMLAIAKRGNDPGIRVGDVIIHADGTRSRVTYKPREGWLQAGGALGGQNFYLGISGEASYSGSFSSPVEEVHLEPVEKTVWLPFWQFLDGHPGARRGIAFRAPCRIYKERPNDV